MAKEGYSKIFAELKSTIESLGYECIGSEFIKENEMDVLRVYLDKQNGIDILDCEKVTREITEYLDSVESLLPNNYLLEVSSPGIERPLFTIDDYKRFVEKEISPYVNERDEAGIFPRELYQKAASVGLMGLGYDAEHGGIPDADAFYVMLAAIEMATPGQV